MKQIKESRSQKWEYLACKKRFERLEHDVGFLGFRLNGLGGIIDNIQKDILSLNQKIENLKRRGK
jgi:hypothetical protein